MLKEIRSEAFRINGKDGKVRDTVIFHKGLNTILGSEQGDNSIGKSIFMLVIDFCFGGNEYAKSNVISYVGNHTICYAHEFDGEKYFFCRSTAHPGVVSKCDNNYKIVGDLKLVEFNEWLFRSYNINLPAITFRGLISRTFRVAGRANDYIIKPLNNFKQTDEEAIVAIERLFDVYQPLEDLKNKLKNAKELEKTYRKAQTLDLVPHNITSKKKLDDNTKLISKLENERDSLVQNIDSELLESELKRSGQVAKLRSRLISLKGRHSQITTKLALLQNHKNGDATASFNEIEKLRLFFPSANIGHLAEIENFHKRLAGILDDEISFEIENLEILLQETNEEVKYIDDELSTLSSPLSLPADFLSEYTALTEQINQLKAQNESYLKVGILKENRIMLEEELRKEEGQTLQSLEELINKHMELINDQLYSIRREAPTIHFKSGKSYEFKTPRDQGTGTAFKSLIVLDLSILQLTKLPFIAHDSLIFKNIGDEPMNKIIEMYDKSDKQIFITFDKTSTYGERVNLIADKTSVLRLGPNGNELFGWSWAKK